MGFGVWAGETEPSRLEWVGLRADPGGMYIRGVGQIFSF